MFTFRVNNRYLVVNDPDNLQIEWNNDLFVDNNYAAGVVNYSFDGPYLPNADIFGFPAKPESIADILQEWDCVLELNGSLLYSGKISINTGITSEKISFTFTSNAKAFINADQTVSEAVAGTTYNIPHSTYEKKYWIIKFSNHTPPRDHWVWFEVRFYDGSGGYHWARGQNMHDLGVAIISESNYHLSVLYDPDAAVPSDIIMVEPDGQYWTNVSAVAYYDELHPDFEVAITTVASAFYGNDNYWKDMWDKVYPHTDITFPRFFGYEFWRGANLAEEGIDSNKYAVNIIDSTNSIRIQKERATSGGYSYPFGMYSGYYSVNNACPAFFLVPLLKKIFEGNGLTYSGAIFTDTTFYRIIVMWWRLADKFLEFNKKTTQKWGNMNIYETQILSQNIAPATPTGEFLTAVFAAFNLKHVFSGDGKSVRLLFFKDILADMGYDDWTPYAEAAMTVQAEKYTGFKYIFPAAEGDDYSTERTYTTGTGGTEVSAGVPPVYKTGITNFGGQATVVPYVHATAISPYYGLADSGQSPRLMFYLPEGGDNVPTPVDNTDTILHPDGSISHGSYVTSFDLTWEGDRGLYKTFHQGYDLLFKNAKWPKQRFLVPIPVWRNYDQVRKIRLGNSLYLIKTMSLKAYRRTHLIVDAEIIKTN